jgi:hypothetical protein
MTYFELRSPRDMLEKARRELRRLQQQLTIDNVFNFFVTAHHIQDYVRRASSVPQSTLDAFLSDPDLKDCGDLCNKGKHLQLTRRPDPSTVIWDSTIGGAPIGALPIGGGERWMLFSGMRQIDVGLLAERVVAKWGSFLDQQKL